MGFAKNNQLVRKKIIAIVAWIFSFNACMFFIPGDALTDLVLILKFLWSKIKNQTKPAL